MCLDTFFFSWKSRRRPHPRWPSSRFNADGRWFQEAAQIQQQHVGQVSDQLVHAQLLHVCSEHMHDGQLGPLPRHLQLGEEQRKTKSASAICTREKSACAICTQGKSACAICTQQESACGVVHKKNLFVGSVHGKNLLVGFVHKKNLLVGCVHKKNLLVGSVHKKNLFVGSVHKKNLSVGSVQ